MRTSIRPPFAFVIVLAVVSGCAAEAAEATTDTGDYSLAVSSARYVVALEIEATWLDTCIVCRAHDAVMEPFALAHETCTPPCPPLPEEVLPPVHAEVTSHPSAEDARRVVDERGLTLLGVLRFNEEESALVAAALDYDNTQRYRTFAQELGRTASGRFSPAPQAQGPSRVAPGN